MDGMLRQYKAAWCVWSGRSQPVKLRTLRRLGRRFRLVTAAWKSTGKPSIIFVLNKENDLTVYRCCWNKYNLLEFTVTFWSYICSTGTEFMCLWSISMLKGNPHSSKMGFSGGSGAESACQCRSHRRCQFDPWVKKIPWWREWQPTPVFLPGETLGQRSLVSYSPWGHKESDTTERLSIAHNYLKMENKWLGLT